MSRQTRGNASHRAVRAGFLLLTFVVLALLAAPGVAQPFGLFLKFDGTNDNAYFEVPHSAALNPTSALTLEAWVYANSTSGCTSIIGKGYTTAYWLGICSGKVRAYFRGSVSHDGGVVPVHQFTHIAVTYDGTTQKHYVNGELVGTFAGSGPPGINTSAVRIGGDTDFQIPIRGFIDEVRLWNVARTQSQIRSTINQALATAQPGLVAVWPLQSLVDPVGHHNGTLVNEDHGVTPIGLYGFYGFPLQCSSGFGPGGFCLHDRFVVSASFRVGAPGTAETDAHAVPVFNPGSGLFWFFAADNWELMVKEVDGCGLNSHHWIFSAATTNVFYRLVVFDSKQDEQRIYFNYPGLPAPAVTDIDAFPTWGYTGCP